MSEKESVVRITKKPSESTRKVCIALKKPDGSEEVTTITPDGEEHLRRGLEDLHEIVQGVFKKVLDAYSDDSKYVVAEFGTDNPVYPVAQAIATTLVDIREEIKDEQDVATRDLLTAWFKRKYGCDAGMGPDQDPQFFDDDGAMQKVLRRYNMGVVVGDKKVSTEEIIKPALRANGIMSLSIDDKGMNFDCGLKILRHLKNEDKPRDRAVDGEGPHEAYLRELSETISKEIVDGISEECLKRNFSKEEAQEFGKLAIEKFNLAFWNSNFILKSRSDYRDADILTSGDLVSDKGKSMVDMLLTSSINERQAMHAQSGFKNQKSKSAAKAKTMMEKLRDGGK